MFSCPVSIQAVSTGTLQGASNKRTPCVYLRVPTVTRWRTTRSAHSPSIESENLLTAGIVEQAETVSPYPGAAGLRDIQSSRYGHCRVRRVPALLEDGESDVCGQRLATGHAAVQTHHGGAPAAREKLRFGSHAIYALGGSSY